MRNFVHSRLYPIRDFVNFVKLHLHGRLLAARIGILPFFFLNRFCFSRFEKKGKMPILAAKSCPCECSSKKDFFLEDLLNSVACEILV